MNDAPVIALSPETVLGEMKKNGVSHVVWLPDSETNWLTPKTPPWVSMAATAYSAVF
jgi:hypothetical protein